MPIKALYAAEDDIPENYKDLYEEKDGSWRLLKIEGIKTDADVSRVTRALEAQRTETRKYKNQWESFLGERSPEEIQEALDRLPELEAAASGAGSEEKINAIVEGRLSKVRAPLERNLAHAQKELQDLQAQVQTYETQERQRKIHDQVRKAASGSKVLDTAHEDVLLLAERLFEVSEDGGVTMRDGVGFTPGIAPDVWLLEMQSKRPHWWPASSGGGATGSGSSRGMANNPWSKEAWSMTRQAEIVRTMGVEKARQIATAANSQLGAVRPA